VIDRAHLAPHCIFVCLCVFLPQPIFGAFARAKAVEHRRWAFVPCSEASCALLSCRVRYVACPRCATNDSSIEGEVAMLAPRFAATRAMIVGTLSLSALTGLLTASARAPVIHTTTVIEWATQPFTPASGPLAGGNIQAHKQ
jgi:hypothetical protein